MGLSFNAASLVSDGLIEATESEVNEATAVHFGALAGILTPFFASQLRERTAQFENLTAYVDRMMLSRNFRGNRNARRRERRSVRNVGCCRDVRMKNEAS